MQKAKRQWRKEHTQKITNTHLNDIAFYLFLFLQRISENYFLYSSLNLLKSAKFNSNIKKHMIL